MTDELISKSDVVKIIKSVLSPASSLIPAARARRQMLNEINELESKPEPHWIPVEQALPNKEGKYLCTRTGTWCVDGKAKKVTDVAILDYSDNIYDIWKGYGEIFQNGFAFGKMWQGKLDNLQKVSAWMPLPKHYKGGVTDDRF